MSTILSESRPTARKEHKCDFCGHAIPVGEKYNLQVGVYDGFYTWKSHVACEELAYLLDMYDNANDGRVDSDYFAQESYEAYVDTIGKDAEFPLSHDQLQKLHEFMENKKKG